MTFYVYNLLFNLCSCLDEEGQTTHIARRYKEFFDRLKKGEKGFEILNDMGIKRMCCRQRYLSIPVEFMIDRSKERYFNHANRDIVTEDTRELKPAKEPPNFPVLPL